MSITYRPDIDGLRAIAVISVVLYHFGVNSFSGGYVGVDIFFVISGYLITSIIVQEIDAGTFCVAKFYERRCRRILPALIVMVAATLAAGVVLFSPGGLVDLAKSAISNSVFVSNFYFYSHSGYFGRAAELKPLLHTWSLAVEEQYYVVFPLIFMKIANKDNKKYKKWLIPATVISFIICVLVMKKSANSSFYLFHGRAWELLTGSILAIGVFKLPQRQITRDILSLTGLMMMLASVFLYTSKTYFPGIAAVLPVIGAALMIYSGIGGVSLAGRLLSLKPLVFVGLLSYSLYLWHWPVIVYAKYYAIADLNSSQKVMMLCLTAILSLLSWKFVEKPFRNRSLPGSSSAVFKTSLAASLTLIGCATLLVALNGLPDRYGNKSRLEVANNDSEWHRWGECTVDESEADDNQELCPIGKDGAPASFILMGDSHARALASAVNLSAFEHGLGGRLAHKNSCPTLMLIERQGRSTCQEFNQAVMNYIARRPNIKTVILAGRWAVYANGTWNTHERGGEFTLVDISSGSGTNLSNIDLVEKGLRRTIEYLQKLGKKVVLVDPVPEVGYDVPSANFAAIATGRDVNTIISPSLKDYAERAHAVTALFTQLEHEKDVEIVDPTRYLCNDKFCKIVTDGIPLYRDDDHLSTFGSRFVAPSFDAVFAEIEKSSQPAVQGNAHAVPLSN